MSITRLLAFRRRPAAIAALFVAGISLGGAGAATVHRFAAVSGTGSEGAFTYNNPSASGGAIEGTVSNAPDTNVKLPFGVLGEYLASSSTFGIGAGGVSTSGYGVGAEALGPNPALYAVGEGAGGAAQFVTSGNGASGTGVTIDTTAASSPNAVPYGLSVNVGGTTAAGNFVAPGGDGVIGQTGSPTSYPSTAAGFVAGVVGFAQSQVGVGQGAMGIETGEGVLALGASGTGAGHPALVVGSLYAGTDYITAYGPPANENGSGVSSVEGPETFAVQAGTANRSKLLTNAPGAPSDVQISGDVYVTGQIHQGCNAFPAVAATKCYDVALSGTATTTARTRTAGGSEVETYGAKQSLPTVEDFGQGRLVAGRATISLDRTFARTISTTSPYLVFITPSGQSHGLYTESRTANGFVVRENDGGRDSLSFDYRIVARPLADASERFPQADVRVMARTSPPTNAALGAFVREARSRSKHARIQAKVPVRELFSKR